MQRGERSSYVISTLAVKWYPTVIQIHEAVRLNQHWHEIYRVADPYCGSMPEYYLATQTPLERAARYLLAYEHAKY